MGARWVCLLSSSCLVLVLISWGALVFLVHDLLDLHHEITDGVRHFQAMHDEAWTRIEHQLPLNERRKLANAEEKIRKRRQLQIRLREVAMPGGSSTSDNGGSFTSAFGESNAGNGEFAEIDGLLRSYGLDGNPQQKPKGYGCSRCASTRYLNSFPSYRAVYNFHDQNPGSLRIKFTGGFGPGQEVSLKPGETVTFTGGLAGCQTCQNSGQQPRTEPTGPRDEQDDVDDFGGGDTDKKQVIEVHENDKDTFNLPEDAPTETPTGWDSCPNCRRPTSEESSEEEDGGSRNDGRQFEEESTRRPDDEVPPYVPMPYHPSNRGPDEYPTPPTTTPGYALPPETTRGYGTPPTTTQGYAPPPAEDQTYGTVPPTTTRGYGRPQYVPPVYQTPQTTTMGYERPRPQNPYLRPTTIAPRRPNSEESSEEDLGGVKNTGWKEEEERPQTPYGHCHCTCPMIPPDYCPRGPP
ncbi:unnamed protein product, partial [Mesorhabditis spiculigera]